MHTVFLTDKNALAVLYVKAEYVSLQRRNLGATYDDFFLGSVKSVYILYQPVALCKSGSLDAFSILKSCHFTFTQFGIYANLCIHQIQMIISVALALINKLG